MITKRNEGLWYAKQAVAPNIICIGFDPNRKNAMKHCFELVNERRKSNGSTANKKAKKA